MIERDVAITTQFFDSFAEVRPARSYFEGLQDAPPDPSVITFFDSLFERLMFESNIIRANVYAKNRSIVWSSNHNFAGLRDDSNEELDQALNGRVTVELGAVGVRGEPEFVEFEPGLEGADWIECYIPIWSEDRHTVVGVVQTYRLIQDLLSAIARGRQLIWVTTLGGGAILYLALFWIVRRAARVIRDQERRLVEAESMAVVGEMTSAVAHGIRNPLASIRSSAELISLQAGAGTADSVRNIVATVDRLTEWVQGLLFKAHGEINASRSTDLNAVTRSSLAGYAGALHTQKVQLTVDLAEALPLVQGDPVMLGHVLNSLLANALEAMPNGGTLGVWTSRDDYRQTAEVRISDSGQGFAKYAGKELPRPFVTNKTGGLGLGLTLSRRIVERIGGTLDLTSTPGKGAVATVQLPISQGMAQ